MVLIDKDKKLSDVILEDPSIVTVLNRFNIFLGVGDKTIRQMCNEKKLNTDFFLIILNTFSNEEYFPEKLFKNFDAKTIIDYLNCTNNYYLHFIIPNIESHFNLLIKRSTDNNTNLELLYKFFLEVKLELINRIKTDSNELFTKIISLNSNFIDTNEPSDEALRSISVDNAIEDKINDLVNMFVIHLSGNYDTNLCLAVLFAIINLKKDICQNNRIRNKILMPIYQYLLKPNQDNV